MSIQRAGFGLGFVVGLLVGIALALGVALYVNKVPIPFKDKLGTSPAPSSAADAERAKTWDPNASLATKPAPPGAETPTAAPSSARDPQALLAGAAPPASKPAADAKPQPVTYFVQIGAFARLEDAETQRAKVAILGVGAKVTEREQSGRTVYRVRVGPFEGKDEADGVQERLRGNAIESALVRVER